MEFGNRIMKKIQTAILVVLLLIFIGECLYTNYWKSLANDELKHLDTGHYFLAKGVCCKGIDNTPLIVLNALPLLWDLEYILAEDNGMFYNGWKYHKYLFWERIPTLLFGLFLGLLIFKWSKELWGFKGGLLSLILFVFSPEIISQFSLVSPDALCTAMIFASLYFFYKFLRAIKNNGQEKRFFNERIIFLIIINGFVFGLAQIAKYSSLALFPILFFVIIVFIILDKEVAQDFSLGNLLSRTKVRNAYMRSLQLIFSIFIIILIAYLIVWLSYGIHLKNDYYEFANGKKIYSFGFGDYLKGIREARMNYTEGFPSFFMGELNEKGDKGWRLYFPVTFIIKTPIPTLIFLLLGTIVLFFKRKSIDECMRKDFVTEFILIFPVIFYFVTAICGNLNIGLRHILQIYPFLFVFIGRLGVLIEIKKWLIKVILGILLLWYMVSSIAVAPNYLGYFNEFIGGMKNGYKYLVDSNMDWGQDLKLLKKWLDKKGIESIQFSYFGFGLPEFYGIRYVYLPSGLSNLEIPQNYEVPPKGSQKGLMAISVTNLQGVYFKVKGIEPDYYYWLKKYKPIAMVGSSILIYDIK